MRGLLLNFELALLDLLRLGKKEVLNCLCQHSHYFLALS